MIIFFTTFCGVCAYPHELIFTKNCFINMNKSKKKKLRKFLNCSASVLDTPNLLKGGITVDR